jgi:hypothetical protein
MLEVLLLHLQSLFFLSCTCSGSGNAPQLPDLLQLLLADAQLVKLHRRTAKLLVPPENAGSTGGQIPQLSRVVYLQRWLRDRPMIRCGGPSDAGLRPRQALREYKVEGGVREAVTPWVGHSITFLFCGCVTPSI